MTLTVRQNLAKLYGLRAPYLQAAKLLEEGQARKIDLGKFSEKLTSMYG